MELDPAAVLRVTVSDSQGQRVGKAEVTLVPEMAATAQAWAVAGEHMAKTDDTGEAVFTRLVPGSYRAHVRREGFLDWEANWSVVAGGTAKPVVLERGAKLLVRVTDRRSGGGIPKAQVRIEGHLQQNRDLSCATSPQGTCEISHVPPGTLVATATAPGRPPARKRLVVPPDRREVEVNIPLGSGLRVHGRVTGAESYQPPLEVRIGIPGFSVRSGPVGPDGQYAIEEVPAGRANVFVREAPSGGALLHRIVTLDEDRDTHELDLELPPPRVLVGWVREAGTPCSLCRVEVTLPGGEVFSPRAERRTDQQGRFEAHLPVVGVYRVQIWSQDGSLRLEDTVEVTMHTERTFELGGGALAGRVVDGDGAPLPGARVSVFRAPAGTRLGELSTGLGGTFRFERLPPGPVQVSAQAEGAWAHREVEVVAGETQAVELVVERRQELTLRLRDANNGLPVRRAALGVQTRAGAFHLYRFTGTPEGEFKLPVAPGDVEALVIGASGYALTTLRRLVGRPPIDVLLSNADPSFTLEVRPKAGTPCAGMLLDSTGLPIALSAEAPPGPLPRRSRTAMFNFVPLGSYELVITTCEGKVFRRPLTLAHGLPPVVALP